MSEKILKKISYVLGILSVGSLLGLVVFLSGIEIRSFDLWLHLKSGEFIVQNGFIPSVDVFSCSVLGQVWNNHEWLFQSLSYFIFSHFGFDGLSSMQSCVVAFTFMFLLFVGDIREKQITTVFLLLLSTLVYQSRFTIRPDIFSLFFLAIYIYLITRHLSKKQSIFFFVIIQLLWVNMHGFFIFGPAIILLCVFTEFIKRSFKLPFEWNKTAVLSDLEYKNLKIIFIFTFLASAANPQFITGLVYPFQILFQMAGESKVFFSSIQELASPLIKYPLLSFSYMDYKLLILISLGSFVVNYKKINLFHFFLWTILLFLSIKALRNMVYFCFVAYWVSVFNFKDLSLSDTMPLFKDRQKLKYIILSIFKISLIIWMFRFGHDTSEGRYYDFKNYKMKSVFGGVSDRNFPIDAVNFLNKNYIQGNFFNDFNSGAYLIGNCFPNIKVFIDGRTELYGPVFFKEYKRIWGKGDKALFDQAVEKYNLTGAFLGSASQDIPEEILKELYEDDDWVLVYLNYDAVIFLKDVEKNKEAIKRLKLNKNNMSFFETNLQKLDVSRVSPYQEIKRARVLEILGLVDLALSQAQHAILVGPGYAEPYFIRGKIYAKREEDEKAFENFRIAAMIFPKNADMRYSLAESYEKLGDSRSALIHYESLVKNNVDNNNAFLKVSQIYINQDRLVEGVNVLRKVKEFKADDAKKLIEIGTALEEKGETSLAQEIYAMVLKVDPQSKIAQDKTSKDQKK